VAFVNLNVQLMQSNSMLRQGLEKWIEINKKYSEIWPNINQKKNPPADADNFRNEKNKYEKYFKENIE